MAIMKPEYWLVSLGLVIVLSVALLNFGNSLANDPNITLDADSSEYLDLYSDQISRSGIKDRAEEDAEEREMSNPLLKWLSGTRLVTDFFGAITFLTNAVSGFWDFVTLAFNLPSFFITTLGIKNVGGLKFIINIIGTVLFLAIVILLVRLVK